MTTKVKAMAEVFLAHYLTDEKDDSLVGDMQSYRVVPLKNKESISEPVRIILPTPKIAEIWSKE